MSNFSVDARLMQEYLRMPWLSYSFEHVLSSFVDESVAIVQLVPELCLRLLVLNVSLHWLWRSVEVELHAEWRFEQVSLIVILELSTEYPLIQVNWFIKPDTLVQKICYPVDWRLDVIFIYSSKLLHQNVISYCSLSRCPVFVCHIIGFCWAVLVCLPDWYRDCILVLVSLYVQVSIVHLIYRLHRIVFSYCLAHSHVLRVSLIYSSSNHFIR